MKVVKCDRIEDIEMLIAEKVYGWKLRDAPRFTESERDAIALVEEHKISVNYKYLSWQASFQQFIEENSQGRLAFKPWEIYESRSPAAAVWLAVLSKYETDSDRFLDPYRTKD